MLTAAEIEPPYLLVRQSMGANIVFMYAQAYPDEVNGFVTMNPVPPYTDWIRRAHAVYSSKAELRSNEISFYEGANDEQVAFQSTDGMLADPLPDPMPYTVMFAEDCGGEPSSATGSCRRSRPRPGCSPPSARVAASSG